MRRGRSSTTRHRTKRFWPRLNTSGTTGRDATVWCRWVEQERQVRVIGGEFRSRRLQSMPGMEVRPTPDKIRESLFNILRGEIEGAVFVDAYGGACAVGIESL